MTLSWFSVTLLLLLAACTVTPVESKIVQAPPAQPVQGTQTDVNLDANPPLPPTHTPTPSPTITLTPTATSTPTQTATPTIIAMPIAVKQFQVIGVNNARNLTRLAYIPNPAVLPAAQASFALSPDGETVAIGNGPTVRLWSILQGQYIRELLPPGSSGLIPGAMAFSPDGAQLARTYQNQIVVWSAATGDVAQVIGDPNHTEPLVGLAYTGSGKNIRLAAAGLVEGQPGLLFWDAASGGLLAESASGDSEVDSFQVSPNGRMVVQAGRDGVIRFWDGVTGQRSGQQIIYACPDSILGTTFNYSGGLIALACDATSDAQPGMRVFFYSPNYYRPENIGLFKVMQFDSLSNGRMAFNTESSLIALTSGSAQVGSRSNRVDIWGFYTQRIEATINIFIRDILQIEFSPDSRLLFLSLSDGSVEIWGVKQ